MINIRIACRNSDGGVSIVMPTPEFCKENPDDILGRLLESLPEGAIFEKLKAENIPEDRYFRDAWRLGGGIKIDRPHAEKIHMHNLRKVRDDKLKAEDVEYQRALEYRDDAKMNAVAARKKKLRDMPTDTDLSGLSLDELKDFVPNVLK